MFAVITPEKIHLPAGTVIRLPGTWQDYQQITKQLGDRTIPRVKYRQGEILLMSPLPVHGNQAHIIAMVIVALLDHLEIDYTAFTPITMELPQTSGIEPYYCFYIDNWAAIAGKDRINWGVDPSPDLAIEIDVTSYTDVNDFLPYRVPEVWIYKENNLIIYGLEGNSYAVKTSSRHFPKINLSEIIAQSLQTNLEHNTSTAMRQLRQKLAIVRNP